MNPSFEALLDNFLYSLTQSLSHSNNLTVEFWKDSFTNYISKMRIPKNIHKNPRRYFHLHAMNYLLDQTQPQVIWNMCVGNIKTSMPILEHVFEQAELTSSPIYIINIDIVPAIVQFNNSFLNHYLKNSIIGQLQHNQFIKFRNTIILNIIGSIEDFFSLFPELHSKIPSIKHVFLCLDGLSNAVIKPNHWLTWWQSVQTTLNKHFEGWYLTLLQASTLETKFGFYYEVVLQKHHIPINWVEIIKFNFSEIDKETLEISFKQLEFSKLSTNSLRNVLSHAEIPVTDLLFRFFSKETKELLVYQALYLTEETIARIVDKTKHLHIGHKDLDQILFTLDEEFYVNKEENFVKSIPVMKVKEKIKKE